MFKCSYVVIFCIGLGLAVLGLLRFLENEKVAAISNFDECMNAGYPVMESYPARCMTPDKRTFTQEVPPEQQNYLIPPKKPNIYPQP